VPSSGTIFTDMYIRENILFWDWNGTLLDDTGLCLLTMNNMLGKRGMSPISIDFYREAFGFPVIDYYRKVGFDFRYESFETLSVEFIEGYNAALISAPITQGAEEVLAYFQNTGKRNAIISAMEQEMLEKSVSDNGLSKYFSDIRGIDNIYAAGKSKLALDFVENNNVLPDNILFIGDTVHDFDVAQEIGCRCILVADGHQTKQRLLTTGAQVINSVLDLLPPDKRLHSC
jgi:phosphoglycolate phosphatase